MDTASNLTLYRKNGACSFVPHALLIELEIPHTEILLDFRSGVLAAADDSFSHEEYKRIHPSGVVPALSWEGIIITELPAVCAYIADLVPERKLLGNSPLERAQVGAWMNWLSGTLHGYGYAMLWRPSRFTDSKDPAVVDTIVAKGRRTILECFELIESESTESYTVGRGLTVVDYSLYIFYRWGALRIGLQDDYMGQKFPKYTELAKQLEMLGSVRGTLEREGMGPIFAAVTKD